MVTINKKNIISALVIILGLAILIVLNITRKNPAKDTVSNKPNTTKAQNNPSSSREFAESPLEVPPLPFISPLPISNEPEASQAPTQTSPGSSQPSPATIPQESNNAGQIYLKAVFEAATDFDLINDRERIQSEFSTLEINTLKRLRSQASQTAQNIKNVPYPKELEDLAQLYSLTYSTYLDFIDRVILIFEDPAKANDEKIQAMEEKFTIFSDTFENLEFAIDRI